VKAAILGGMPADRLRVVHDPNTKTIAVEVRGESAPEDGVNPWLGENK
jgi:hypothetical protein